MRVPLGNTRARILDANDKAASTRCKACRYVGGGGGIGERWITGSKELDRVHCEAAPVLKFGSDERGRDSESAGASWAPYPENASTSEIKTA
jgi:hypothetical protein